MQSRITNNQFDDLVAEGLDAIPEKFQRRLSNVAIVVGDEPTAEQRKRLRLRRDHTLFGLYEGTPQTARGWGYYWVLPDKITIFRKPILEYAHSPDEVKTVVRDTVWHEIAHHFGLDHCAIRRQGKRRNA